MAQRHSEHRPMAILNPLLHQLRRQIAQLLAVPPSSKAYQRWQERFIRDRLRLTLYISMGILTVLAIVNGVVVIPALTSSTNEALKPTLEQYQFYPYVFAAQQLGLGLNLLLLRRATLAKRLRWHFLGYSAAILLAPQMMYMLLGTTVVDLGGWILFFMLQAVLIPVRWRWHLISQVNLLAIMGASTLIFRFDSPGMPPEIQLSVYLFVLVVMLCVYGVADFGIYLYERLLRREFELRQQRSEERRVGKECRSRWSPYH